MTRRQDSKFIFTPLNLFEINFVIKNNFSYNHTIVLITESFIFQQKYHCKALENIIVVI